METIDVGRVGDTGDIFIGVPSAAYEEAKKPISGQSVHVSRFSRDDVRWLIKALQKELRRRPRKRKQAAEA